ARRHQRVRGARPRRGAAGGLRGGQHRVPAPAAVPGLPEAASGGRHGRPRCGGGLDGAGAPGVDALPWLL
ncbi:unnamed protein product, partial [Prorocentrum cordatum]